MGNIFSCFGGSSSRRTEGSFKNYGTGPQNFEDSKIKSDSCSCVQNRSGSGNKVVYHSGGGPQNLQGAKINGVKVESRTNYFSRDSSSSVSQTTSSVIHCTSTRGSFNNHRSGSQSFKGATINIGSN